MKPEKKAKEILYQFCGDKQVNDGKSLYYLGGQENEIIKAIEYAMKYGNKDNNMLECDVCKCKPNARHYLKSKSHENDQTTIPRIRASKGVCNVV